ncbi:MAG TPA: PQQ-dependent sugar dehydrogenase [Gemmatimonadaceae bacterium]|nr:PQQ-dependent sugar dehydrogenase [Gemmatimonadaceae bacterium]
MRRTLASPLLVLTAAVACGDPTTTLAPPGAPARAELSIAAVGPSPMGAPIAIDVEEVATGFVSPVQLVTSPGAGGRRFVIDQIGKIWALNAGGNVMPKPFLDISSKITPLRPGYDERGLLGLAFHPDYQRNGRFFVFYTAPPGPSTPAGWNNRTTIAEYSAQGGQAVHADAGSERIILQIDHPQANHNGGTVAFGPDGYLYISIGDGGGRDDEQFGHVPDWYAFNAGGNGQDITSNLMGNILRIDVDRGSPYAIPNDNPYVQGPGLDEIWAYGFRNPYRFSFDMGGSRALLVGDAGQELWEEVSRVDRGGNYGWNVKEGTHCFDAANPTVSPATCPSVDPTTNEPLRDPVIEFANSKQAGGLALTVVGGNVYRGKSFQALSGMYVFGGATASFTSPDGRLYASPQQGGGLWTIHELLLGGTTRLGYVVKGFGNDADGNVYIAASKILGPAGTTGTIFKIVAPVE